MYPLPIPADGSIQTAWPAWRKARTPSGVTLTPTVVDALSDQWVPISGGTSRAVRVVITKDPDAQPNVADEPTPGDNYRVMIIATRSDSVRPIARDVPLRIWP